MATQGGKLQTELPRVTGYRVLARLGHGGMGAVYRALPNGSTRPVALKILHRTDPLGLYHLKREFRALADIAHPNLASLYELVCTQQTWFFTMELVTGCSLLEHLGVPGWSPYGQLTEESAWPAQPSEITPPARQHGMAPGVVDEGQLRAAFLQIAEALDALHSADKLHGDIKPSNVMVEQQTGRVVLLDFGLASDLTVLPRALDGSVQGGASAVAPRMGTPGYMSPEQSGGLSMSPRSDCYQMGVMLYEALCGVLPFSGPTPFLLEAKRARMPLPPSRLRPDVPKELESLCLSLLEPQPSARPSAREAARALEGGSQVGSRRPRAPRLDGPRPLIGRERELSQLSHALREMAPGRARVLIVKGRSGIGKTRLIEHFLEQAESAFGAAVLRGRCHERESVPYKAFDSIIDALAQRLLEQPASQQSALAGHGFGYVGRLFPVLRRVPALAEPCGDEEGMEPFELRRRAFVALKQLLAMYAGGRPLLLGIDDLQWGDVESARLLLELLEPSDVSLLVVATMRDEDAEQSSMLCSLREDNDARAGWRDGIDELELAALHEEDALTLARALLGPEQTPERALAIAREAEGHPFLLYELWRSFTLGAPAAPDERADARSRESLRLDRVLTDRIALLPSEARRFLELVAVAGRTVVRRVVSYAAEHPPAENTLWQLLSTGHYVRVAGEPGAMRVECYHDRLREAVVATLSPEELCARHGRLARGFECAQEGDPEQLLEHYRGAGELEQAREHAIEAAHAAAETMAFARAARLYRAALTLAPSDAEQAAMLQQKLARALVHAGLSLEAAEEFASARERASGLEHVELTRLCAQHYLIGGEATRGAQMLREALGEFGIRYPRTRTGSLLRVVLERLALRLFGLGLRERSVDQISARVLARLDTCFSAAAGLSMIDPVRSAAFSARHLRLAIAAGEPQRVARALALELGIAPATGEEGLRWAKRALPLAERLGQRYPTPYQRGLLFLARGNVAYLSGQFSEMRSWMERAEESLRDARDADVQWALQTTSVLLSLSLVVVGDLRTARRRVPGLVREARERGDPYSVAMLGYARTLVELAQDDVAAARRVQEDVPARPRTGEFHVLDFMLLHAALLVDRYEGAHEQAWRRIEQAWPQLTRSNLLAVNMVRISAWAERGSAALAAHEGPPPRAQREVAWRAALQLERERLPLGAALAALLRARAAYQSGNLAEAQCQLERASVRFDAIDLSLYAVCARRELGLLIGGPRGRALTQRAEELLRAQTIVNTARFSSLMVPGFELLAAARRGRVSEADAARPPAGAPRV